MAVSILSTLRQRIRGGILGAVPDWLTVNEAAAYLKVHRATIYELIRRGVLPYYTLKGARDRRFKREDLDALLEPGGREDGKSTGTR